MPSNNSAKYKVAAIGPEELLSGLESLGVTVFPASNSETAKEKIFEVIEMTENNQKPFAIMLVVENLLEGISQDDYAKITKHPLPALLSIPSLNSSEDTGLEKLRDMTTRAIGSDIFSS